MTLHLGVQSLTEQELTSRADRMREALFAAFAPTELTVTDDSALHHGHAGAAPGGETHYSVRIRSAAFAGQSRVQRHRMINDALAAEFANGLHALAIDAAAPDA